MDQIPASKAIHTEWGGEPHLYGSFNYHGARFFLMTGDLLFSANVVSPNNNHELLWDSTMCVRILAGE